MPYAADTKVPASRTREELTQLLKKRGATSIASSWSEQAAQVAFEMRDRIYKITIPLATKAIRGVGSVEQIERSRWRTLQLVVKAKLEAVDAGVSTVEAEFLSYTVMPDGRTVYEHTQQAIENAYSSGSVKPLLELT